MASISKRKYFVDGAGKEVPRGTPGAQPRESRVYRIRYTAGGKRVSVRGYADLRATQQLAARLEGAAARGEELMVDRYADHNRRPLREHLADYLKDLEMRGRDDHYRYELGKRLEVLIKECGWTRLRDITAPAFIEWQRRYFGQPRSSGKTLNQFRDSLRSWMNWLCSKNQQRMRENPVAGVQTLPHEPTFLRRALEPAEIEALYLAATPERRTVYAFAVTTGLRRQEIEDLEWGDVILDTPAPFLSLRAKATKARRADRVPLAAAIATMLKALRPAGWEVDGRVFNGVPSVEALRADLAAAGVKLPDGGGEAFDRIDFHGLRTTLGSFIGQSGIAERVGMELLRVTDPKLLRKTYCDPRILQTAAAVRALAIPTPNPSAEAGGGVSPVHYRTAPVDGGSVRLSVGRSGILTVEEGETLCLVGSDAENGGGSRRLSDSEESSARRTRTFQKSVDFPGSFKFPDPAGPPSDNALTPSPDAILTALSELWPRLPLTVRTSIFAIAQASAVDVASSHVGRGSA